MTSRLAEMQDGSGAGTAVATQLLLLMGSPPDIPIISFAAAAVWSSLDRNGKSNQALMRWYRLFLRLLLAGQMFTGSVEIAAGLLLILPVTATMGTLLALLATSEIFVLNLTYDVCVKLVSLHLVLISLFLLAPDLPRLLNFLLQKQEVQPLPARKLFAS